MANDCFSYWETAKWLELAEDNEIIYGYYSEDDLSAEFVSWVDVAAYVDKKMN